MKLQCFGSCSSFSPFILSLYNMHPWKIMFYNSALGLSLIFGTYQRSWAHQSEATLRQANLLKTHCDTKAVAESNSFNISGRWLTYLLCYSHFWARGSSFLFILHSTHQTSTFLPTAKILASLVCIIVMPKETKRDRDPGVLDPVQTPQKTTTSSPQTRQ